MPSAKAWRVLVAIIAIALGGCARYSNLLVRTEQAYSDHAYERALAMARVLEPNTDALNEDELERYTYVRGMCDYRLGHASEARHWLALSDAMAEDGRSRLPVVWQERRADALEALNDDYREAHGQESEAEPGPIGYAGSGDAPRSD